MEVSSRNEKMISRISVMLKMEEVGGTAISGCFFLKSRFIVCRVGREGREGEWRGECKEKKREKAKKVWATLCKILKGRPHLFFDFAGVLSSTPPEAGPPFKGKKSLRTTHFWMR
jgi:hypothetical protein